jgi:high-affinity iron transporter
LYRSGNAQAARDAAIRGYLEGFELVEASLSNVDGPLVREIEREMMELRDAIERRTPAEAVAQRAERMDRLLAAAADKLGAGELSPGTAFTTSLLILLREGLEAILVLAAIVAFVLKTGRREALRWVHAGWVAALVAGALTWAAATFLVEISGASRELTEGVTALVAAATLLYVGYWLHAKSHADAWTRFIRQTVGQALARRTRWALSAVAFLAVYREVFEIVLFYQALWAQTGQGGRTAVVAGAGTAALLLGITAFVILKYSVRLPIGPFFKAASTLLALFAAVFAGHGVAALQEAGVIPVHAFAFDPMPLLGIYPSAEALGAQLLALVLIVLGFWSTRSRA